VGVGDYPLSLKEEEEPSSANDKTGGIRRRWGGNRNGPEGFLLGR